MPAFKVKVKWGRELFPDIEVNTDEEPILFKAQLFALTGVQPERQKVMCKGGILKDNEWNLQLKDGATVLLLGTKEQVPEEPVTPVKFIEDMNDAEMANAMELPAGLTNLGNTCYMNATVQCLHVVPELREALEKYRVDSEDSGSMSTAMASAIKFLFKQMERGSTVTPIILLQTLHRASPQFSQVGENGTYRQQDANECWSELLKMLQQKIPASNDKVLEGSSIKKYNSFIEQYFGGSFEVKMSCTETEEEEPTIAKEQFLQLSCFISTEVKYMHSGLKSRMKEQLVKRSETLGRDANYIRTSLISRLPAYLTIQFVRFQYKGKEGINAKVLKDIKFPIEFDAFELCTPELQNKLCPMRAKFKEAEDKHLEGDIKAIAEQNKISVNETDKTVETENYWFEDDPGSNNSGYYTLQAVLTHKGRSSSSGHYVAWVKHTGDIWFKFDDDVVTSVTTEDILRLSGGGDWHCAYVLLYGPKLLKKQ
ncbi:PREDICTED: ubiquitin carboxyl-terminal hydrolase 14 [Rhagoletis zephyria]|uniref:ubiquitin carboxyl-terminal hydrolase 14 n=1 Tax=Rhagoletis zephyria TaxID=28612 RepID=UPI0008115634|nr:PREDICTED: ubiquitin carboxyl-terminal hydrolase 14 [Rhagoletis zephyria]